MQEILEKFQDAILQNHPPVATEIIRYSRNMQPEDRLAIYTEGYRLRLLHALKTDYPALLQLIGEVAFERLALSYSEHHPSLHFNLDRYPQGFAGFACQHLQEDFAREVATLENTIAVMFMAEESRAMELSVLHTMTPEAFAGVVFKPRLAAARVQFKYPVSRWLDRQRAGDNSPVPEPDADYLFVYRHQYTVKRIKLSPAAWFLLEKLCQGLALENAVETVTTTMPHYENEVLTQIAGWVPDWIAKGFFRV